MNEDKTKYLIVARRCPTIDKIIVDNYSFEKVNVFRYQSVNVNSCNNTHEEINK